MSFRRNNESPVIVYTEREGLYLLDAPSRSVGFYRHTKPVINELPIEAGMLIVVFTDGLRHAGSLAGNPAYDPVGATERLLAEGGVNAQIVADTLLEEAVARDNGRPRDDISVLTLFVQNNEIENDVRRLRGTLPL
ncbi:MAG: SpoIIE family protein phosphatase [Chloroflexota bacterium]